MENSNFFFKRGTAFYTILNMIEWYVKIFIYLSTKNITCINAHSLSTLPISVFFKWFKKCKLIYDAHEIETETSTVQGVRKLISKKIEQFFIKYSDVIVLTSKGHANWYKKQFPNLKVVFIRNCPYLRNSHELKNNFFREQFSIPDNNLIFIYQGAISRPRGINILIEVFQKSNPNKHIVFMGFGQDASRVKAISQTVKNIHFHSAVNPNDVWKYTSSADVGIHMMDDSCVNHLYALPNKPMEYLNVGLPAIVSNLPEMSSLIIDSNAGWVVEVNSAKQLLRLVNSMEFDEVQNKSKIAIKWSKENNWEKEALKLYNVYEELGFLSQID